MPTNALAAGPADQPVSFSRRRGTALRLGRPLRAALIVGGVNLALSVAWILLSSRIAARLAGSVAELQRIESVKGIAFVVAMSLLLGLVTWALLRRVERQQELLERQRAALVAAEGRALAGLVAASVAHDMNNLLGIAFGQVDLMRMDGVEASRLGDLDGALDRLAELSRRLQSLGRSAGHEPATDMDLAGVVADTVTLVSRHAHVRGCALVTDLPGTLPFRGSETLVARIVTNLVLNAAEATEGRGRVRVRLVPGDDAVRLEVDDDGPGIPAERRASVFEPFVTGKADGTGLGLVSVRAAAGEMGGRVEVAGSDLGGACFRVTLPTP